MKSLREHKTEKEQATRTKKRAVGQEPAAEEVEYTPAKKPARRRTKAEAEDSDEEEVEGDEELAEPEVRR